MNGDVTVRWGWLDGHDADGFETVLSPAELDRAASFRFARDRSRYVVARGLLRTLLGERLGIDPERVAFAYGEHGKPRLAEDTGLRFNLSHSNGLMALGLCEGREVGVDVEAKRDELFTTGIARRYLPARAADEIERRTGTERTAEFFRAWVRQEAYAKGRGVGLELIGESPRGWSIADLDLAGGFAAAVAIEGAPVQVDASSI
jgi:4'-phosphopantetheinyl transferase